MNFFEQWGGVELFADSWIRSGWWPGPITYEVGLSFPYTAFEHSSNTPRKLTNISKLPRHVIKLFKRDWQPCAGGADPIFFNLENCPIKCFIYFLVIGPQLQLGRGRDWTRGFRMSIFCSTIWAILWSYYIWTLKQ